MKIEIDRLNKIVYLTKFNFSNIQLLNKAVNEMSANNVTDYNVCILERGESPASCFELYDKFKALLIQHNFNNKIYLATETQVDEYHSFIKDKFGWECVFLTSFYDYPRMYENTYELNFGASVHIHHWQLNYKIPIQKKIQKHFLTLNRSYRNEAHWHRMELYSFMKEFNLLDKANASFRFIKEFDNNFDEPINHIDDINSNHNLYTQIDLKRLYETSFITLLTESNFQSTIKMRLLSADNTHSDEYCEFPNDYLTEKTSRSLMLGMPFILIGPPNSLKRLHSLGFKTFDSFIDESYDNEMDFQKRFDMIKAEINKIASLTIDEMESIYDTIYPTLLHNRNNIKNIQNDNAKKIQTLWN
jgi:hypothetical protein